MKCTYIVYDLDKTGDVEDESVRSDDLRISARSTFERLREETRGREEEDLVRVGFGRYRLLMEGDVKGALDEISSVQGTNEEALLLRETCLGVEGSEVEVESWSPINRAAYYDSKKDYERSVKIWNTSFEVKDESDDDEIAAAALTSLGRRLCLERTELGRADEVLQRAMRFYTKDPEHDKIRFSYTLAWLGAVQHAQEKAVTAEGLMRTATDTMESLFGTMDIQETAAYCEALGAYARLLSEWDKREREAEKMQAKADSIESKLSKIVLPSFHVGGSWWDSTLFSK